MFPRQEDWADTHTTRVWAADRLCHHHHLLTTQGWRLEAGDGKRRILPPERIDALAGGP